MELRGPIIDALSLFKPTQRRKPNTAAQKKAYFLLGTQDRPTGSKQLILACDATTGDRKKFKALRQDQGAEIGTPKSSRVRVWGWSVSSLSVCGVYRVFTRSSKRPALARVFWIHLLNVQQTSSKCIQNTRANAGRLLDRVNTPSGSIVNYTVFHKKDAFLFFS